VRGGSDARIAPSPNPLPGGRGAISVGERELRLAWPIDLGLTVASHGGFHLEHALAERTGTIAAHRADAARSARSGAAAGPADSRDCVEWFPDDATAEILRGSGTGSRPSGPGARGSRRCDGAGAEAASWSAGVTPAARRPSTRISSDVLTVNTSCRDLRMSAALVGRPGGGAFPTPDAMLDYGGGAVARAAKLGFRAPRVAAPAHARRRRDRP